MPESGVLEQDLSDVYVLSPDAERVLVNIGDLCLCISTAGGVLSAEVYPRGEIHGAPLASLSVPLSAGE